MKKIIYLWYILGAMVLAGCSEDESTKPTDPLRGLVNFPKKVTFLPNGEPWYGKEYISSAKSFEKHYLKRYLSVSRIYPIGSDGNLQNSISYADDIQLLGHHDPILYFESDSVLYVYSGLQAEEKKFTRMSVILDFTDGSVRSGEKFIGRLLGESTIEAFFFFPYGESHYAFGAAEFISLRDNPLVEKYGIVE